MKFLFMSDRKILSDRIEFCVFPILAIIEAAAIATQAMREKTKMAQMFRIYANFEI